MPSITPRHGLESVGFYMVGISKLPGFNRVAKLSSNESPLGMSPRAAHAARLAVAKSHLYPEVDTDVLGIAIAENFDLDAKNIAFGPGSDELLTRIVGTFAGHGDEVIFSRNAYMQFPIYAKRAGAMSVAAPDQDFQHNVDSLLNCVTGRTRVVIIANPDNPSGTYLPDDEIRRLRKVLPDNVLLIVDAAYDEYAYADDYHSATSLVENHDNIVVTRTFSKVFGMAGLRIGWCYGPANVIDMLERIGPSFPTNVVAAEAALTAVRDTAHTQRVLAYNRKWLCWFSDKLRALGLTVYPSQTNFVLVRFPESGDKSAAAAYEHLLSQGIIPRKFAVDNFGDKLRFTIGRAKEMQKAANVLASFLAD